MQIHLRAGVDHSRAEGERIDIRDRAVIRKRRLIGDLVIRRHGSRDHAAQELGLIQAAVIGPERLVGLSQGAVEYLDLRMLYGGLQARCEEPGVGREYDMVASRDRLLEKLRDIGIGILQNMCFCLDPVAEGMLQGHAAQLMHISPAGHVRRLVVDKRDLELLYLVELEEPCEDPLRRLVRRLEHHRHVGLALLRQDRQIVPDLIDVGAHLFHRLRLHLTVRIQ